MSRILLAIVLILSLSACKSKNKVVTKKSKSSKTITSNNTKRTTTTNYPTTAKQVVDNAIKFDGVRYKYGGASKKGMDCSGLVYTSFKQENITLPRTTSQLSKTGNWIDLKEVQEGDLLFFATKKNSRTVNHVGIVTNSRIGNVEFIHASTSRGVMISSLAERYWYFAFVQARRIL